MSNENPAMSHSLFKGEFDSEFLSKPYETPYRLHTDGFTEEFLDDALSKTQHRLFGPWGLIGDKGGNTDFADKCSMYIFGQIYGRGGLDLKTRGFLVLSALSVLQRENVIPTWTNACLNLGWTEDELNELGALVSHMSGFPPSRAALMIYEDVFAKRKAAAAKEEKK